MQISGQAHQEKRIKLSKIRNERREITTDTAEIQKRRIAWTIICQKIGQARKKNRFLETYSPPKLNEEEIDNLNRTITRHEIEPVVRKKKLPTYKSSELDDFTGEFHQTYKEEFIPILLKLFQKTEEEGTLP